MAGNVVLGIGELRANFEKLSKEMKTGSALRIAAKGAGILKKEARAIAQAKGLRKTGAMIANIAIKREKTPDGIAEYHLGVRHGKNIVNAKKSIKYFAVSRSGRIVTRRDNDPYYWKYLHFGTKYIRNPTPFITDALKNKQAEAIAAMENQAIKELDRVKK